MISRQMTFQKHSRIGETKLDKYGQEISEHIDLGLIEVAIFTKDPKISYTSPIYLNATHIGLTRNKDVKQNDIIGDYKVDFVDSIGRYTQLVLSEVK